MREQILSIVEGKDGERMSFGEVTGKNRWFHDGYALNGGSFGGVGDMDLNIMRDYARGDERTYRFS